MTILDCCMSLKGIKKLGCVGSCGYAPASVKNNLNVRFEQQCTRARVNIEP